MSAQPDTTHQNHISHFRGWNHPRRHVPRIWFDGHTWNLSVIDPYGIHHIRCADTWGEVQSFARIWALINAAHQLLPKQQKAAVS